MASPAERKFEVLVVNQIASAGLKRLPAERYNVVDKASSPDVILVRSRDLHSFAFGPELRAVGRAGAGVNNIPVAELSGRGIPVFNAVSRRRTDLQSLARILARAALIARRGPGHNDSRSSACHPPRCPRPCATIRLWGVPTLATAIDDQCGRSFITSSVSARTKVMLFETMSGIAFVTTP